LFAESASGHLFPRDAHSWWLYLALAFVFVGTISFAGCGTGVVPTSQLTASPTSVNFGNVAVGSNGIQSVILTNSGSANLTISQVTVSGFGFGISGLTTPLTLAVGQSSAFTVQFAPQATGNMNGSVSLVSNATNSPTTIALSGSGVQLVLHSVTLSWGPSLSEVAGYNVYRSTQSGGPYTKLNSSPVSTTAYTDSTVQAGQTYFYVATAVDSENVESVFSNEISATIPTP